ncbi:hypothetical protein GCE86_25665 [Micromonospora terminaliae]|uniref:Uncharacterized protein n=1 Tax=Micromonospora terminaliae TaxID=1914461 RepID=A0AAJ3DKG3_9ACTN|nr:hypothetical protein [Micromonospora terminaliae]NES29701.1 hypothetical protein [Micromonospora terminaliae]QGL50108.1 hypothetical protein GCE86_25665 [Micromonospora terminaliae]
MTVQALEVLTEFGSTGRVGLLHRGAPLRELVAVHGVPWAIGRVDRSRRWPHLYAYGDVEIVVCRCRLIASISVQTWRRTLELPDPLRPGQVVTLPARVTHRQLLDALAAAHCQWEPLQPIEGQCGIRTLPQRVEFTFVTDLGPEPLLDGAGSWWHAHDCISPSAAAAAFPDDFPPEQEDA